MNEAHEEAGENVVQTAPTRLDPQADRRAATYMYRQWDLKLNVADLHAPLQPAPPIIGRVQAWLNPRTTTALNVLHPESGWLTRCKAAALDRECA